MLASILNDVRFATRQLRRAPFFSLSVMLTLALSIGATAALTGVLRATLLHPLPYPQSGQLVTIDDENLKGFKDSGLVSIPRTADLADLQAGGGKLFSSLGFYYSDESTLGLDSQTYVRVPAVAVSGTFFSTIGSPALLGRTVGPADDAINGPQLLVISYRLWQTRFGGDPSVIGKVVKLGSDQATIVGVMPSRFDMPSGIDVWHPGHVFASSFGSYRGDGGRFADVVARLAPGQTLDSARAATAQLAATLAKTYPESDSAWGFKLTTLRESLFGPVRQPLLLLAAAVSLVLLVAGVNIAGLQLSRNAARAQEFSIRGALGITQARLTRQLLTESLLLVLSGAAAGVTLASALLRIADAWLPASVLLVDRPHVDLAVMAVSLTVAALVGLATAALPAMRARQLIGPMGSRTLVGRTGLFGKGFAALQIGLALVLLTLSGTVLQNLYRLLTTPLGFEATNLQTFTVDFPWTAKIEDRLRLYQQFEQEFAAIPGVSGVGSMSALPFSPFSVLTHYDIAGQPPTPKHDAVSAEFRNMSPGILRTMGIPLLAGRGFTDRDSDANAPAVMLINQTLAKRYFAGTNPVGQRLTTVAPSGTLYATEIVGVVGDVRGTGGSLNVPLQAEIYRPVDGSWPHLQFVLRSTLPVSELDPQIRRIVTQGSSLASVGNLSTLSKTVEKTLTEPKLNASLLGGFAALSLLLVAIGVYGLVAFDVAQRTRELGLRIALGSSRGGVLTLLLADSTRILAIGLSIGIAASFTASRLVAAAVFGTQPHLTALLLTSTAILALAVLAATLLPAVRAARIDPIEALRTE
jgi:putative ABC transport system permease protein